MPVVVKLIFSKLSWFSVITWSKVSLDCLRYWLLLLPLTRVTIDSQNCLNILARRASILLLLLLLVMVVVVLLLVVVEEVAIVGVVVSLKEKPIDDGTNRERNSNRRNDGFNSSLARYFSTDCLLLLLLLLLLVLLALLLPTMRTWINWIILRMRVHLILWYFSNSWGVQWSNSFTFPACCCWLESLNENCSRKWTIEKKIVVCQSTNDWRGMKWLDNIHVQQSSDVI